MTDLTSSETKESEKQDSLPRFSLTRLEGFKDEESEEKENTNGEGRISLSRSSSRVNLSKLREMKDEENENGEKWGALPPASELSLNLLDLSTGDGQADNEESEDQKSEDQKSEEQNFQADPVWHELETGDDSKYHDTIKDEDWDNFKKLIKKYKSRYYKKKRFQVRKKEKEVKEYISRKEQEEEEKKVARKNGEDEEEKLTTSEKIKRHIPFMNRDKDPDPREDKKSVVFAKKILPQVVSKKIFVEPADIVSPLLMVDSDGRTPLHLAFFHKAPEPLIMDLLEAEKKATIITDLSSQLPLHYAINTWQHDHILEKIIQANPSALKTKDVHGRTPIGLAVQLAIQGRDQDMDEDLDDPFLWISPTSEDERFWQFDQEIRWSKVNCLLRELIDRRKFVIPSEHGLILEALVYGANPNTIVRFVTTTDKYLRMDDELAGTAIGLCAERHYPLDTLEYLMESCRDKTTVITDIVQKAINAHYSKGCHPLRDGIVPFGKRVIDWAKKEKKKEKKRRKKEKKEKKKKKLGGSIIGDSQKKVSFQIAGDKYSDQNVGEKWDGMKPMCKDWWENLNHLIFYCAYGRDYQLNVVPKPCHLLHAALSAPMTPPSLIHLLLIVYPEALYEKCPVYKVYPIHVLCTRWRYDIIYNESDASSLDKLLLYLCESDPDQLFYRHKGSLPIHMALFAGQFWQFVRPLISTEKKILGMRDAQSKLFPFQIAALPIRFRNIQLFMRCQFNPNMWREMTFREKRAKYEVVLDGQETRQLSTVFELLRNYPDAVRNIPLSKDSTLARNLRSLSEVSIHYLTWVYSTNSSGKFSVRYSNLTALRNSVFEARILPELQEWCDELKEIIWNNSHTDIPRTNNFLLHSALYNCETPPLVNELLIQLYPSSIGIPIPGTTTYPLHIAAGTDSHQRQQFEIPYGMNNLTLVLKAYKEAVRLESNGRLPLHICLARGKSWKEVWPLIMVDPSSLKVKDGQTGLFPFELMATYNLKENSLGYSAYIEKQMKTFGFNGLTTKEKAKTLNRARNKKELSQLTCIFELIRKRPSVLAMRSSGFMPTTDDDSITSLYSFVDDGYEMKGGLEQWEMLNEVTQNESQGDFDELLMSPVKPVSSLFGDEYTPALITPTPNMSREDALPNFVREKSRISIQLEVLKNKSKKKREERNNSNNLNSSTHSNSSHHLNNSNHSNSSNKFLRRDTKVSLFDFTDLDFIEDEEF